MINKPANGEYHVFYENYISKIVKDNILEVLQDQANEIPTLLRSISEEKSKYRYAVGKWTVAELLHHIIDTERVFAYRAFAIARGDKASFPGMDQDDYANAAFTDCCKTGPRRDHTDFFSKSSPDNSSINCFN